MTAALRRIGITPGSGSTIGAVDTDATDPSGNVITAQAVAIFNDNGEVADIPALLGKLIEKQDETNEYLSAIFEVLAKINP